MRTQRLKSALTYLVIEGFLLYGSTFDSMRGLSGLSWRRLEDTGSWEYMQYWQ